MCMTVRQRFCIIAVWFAATVSPTLSQEIQKLDPALDEIVPASTTLERIATGFNKWTEGPVWTRDGSLLFAEIPSNNIIRSVPGQVPRVFMHPSGYEGSAPFKGAGAGVERNDARRGRAGHGRRTRMAHRLAVGILELTSRSHNPG
jgi:hypothetical protein